MLPIFVWPFHFPLVFDSFAQRRLKSRRKAALDDLEGVQISQLDIDSGDKELADAKKKHETLQTELNGYDFDEKISSKNKQIREADETREDLTNELNALNRHAEYRAKLDMKKKEVEDKKAGIERMWVEPRRSLRSNVWLSSPPQSRSLSNNRDTFYRFKSAEPQAETMEQDVSRLISGKESDLRTSELQNAEKNKVVQQIESNLGLARRQSREKTKIMEGEWMERSPMAFPSSVVKLIRISSPLFWSD